MIADEKYIICNICGTKFERAREYRSCSNCFVCTGCEIYYCPSCDEEIVLIPVRKMGSGDRHEDPDNKNETRS